MSRQTPEGMPGVVVSSPGMPLLAGKQLAVTLAAVGAWLVYTVVLGLLYVRVPPGPDQAIFDYIGWVAKEGGRLYLDVTEVNWPGTMWLHALSTWLFDNHLWSSRLFDYLLALLSAGLLALLVRPAAGRLGSFLIVPLYQAMYVSAGLVAAERDVIAAHILLGVMLAYRARVKGGGRIWLVLAALIFALALMIRPTYALFAPLIVLADGILSRGEDRPLVRVAGDAALAAACCAVPLAAVGLYGWRTGALLAWYDAGIRFNLFMPEHTSYGWATGNFLSYVGQTWHWYIAFSIAGAWLWWREGRDRFTWAMLCSLAITSIASAYVQLKGTSYHLGAMLPIFAAFIAYFLAWSALRARRSMRPAWLALTLVVFGVAALGLTKKISSMLRPQLAYFAGRLSQREMLAAIDTTVPGCSFADITDAADYIQRTVPPQERVLVWTRAVQINFLAKRRSPTRFIHYSMFRLAYEPFPLAKPWAQELEDAFERRPPEVIVLPGPKTGPDYQELWNEPNPSPGLRVVLRQLRSRYVRETAFGSLEIYRLRHGQAIPGI